MNVVTDKAQGCSLTRARVPCGGASLPASVWVRHLTPDMVLLLQFDTINSSAHSAVHQMTQNYLVRYTFIFTCLSFKKQIFRGKF